MYHKDIEVQEVLTPSTRVLGSFHWHYQKWLHAQCKVSLLSVQSQGSLRSCDTVFRLCQIPLVIITCHWHYLTWLHTQCKVPMLSVESQGSLTSCETVFKLSLIYLVIMTIFFYFGLHFWYLGIQQPFRVANFCHLPHSVTQLYKWLWPML